MFPWASIDVCVCTFRRPSLADTLRSIASQALPLGISVRVIVADNDDTPSAQALTEQICLDCGISLLYVHAPARNISIARNMCISKAEAQLVAFIDDDETASANWLAALVTAMHRDGADVVFGPVQAIYSATAPAWLRRTDLHSIQPVVSRNGAIMTGYTSNVLLNCAILRIEPAPRFNVDLGRSGGEDTLFFHDLHDAGVRMAYCPGAVVSEIVPPQRGRMSWLARRAFRMGQTHGRVLNKGIKAGEFGARFSAIALAAAKLLFCLHAGLAGIVFSRTWRRQFFRAALHAGVVAKLSGAPDVTIY